MKPVDLLVRGASPFLEILLGLLLRRPGWYAPGADRSCLQAGVSPTYFGSGLEQTRAIFYYSATSRQIYVVEMNKILRKKAFGMVICSSPLTRMCSGYIVRSYWMLLT